MARVTLQECCDQARELIGARKYTEAIAVCRHILKRYPRHIRTYQILGEACLENRELPEASDTFRRLLDNADPENFAAYAGLGVAYEDNGQITEAIWYMERAFELAPNNEETRNTLRRLYRQRDGVEPDRIRHSKAALARLYTRGGQYHQAIEEFHRLLELDEHRDRTDLKVSLVEALWRDGRREQAAELARQVLQTAPDCLKLILILGKIALEKGRPEEGRAILDKARCLDPENRLAQALFGDKSPLLPAVVLIPRPDLPTEAGGVPPASTEVVAESAAAAVEEGTAPAAEGSAVEESTPAVVAVPAPPVEESVAPVVVPEVLGEEASAAAPGPVVSPPEEQIAPATKRRKRVALAEAEAAAFAPEAKGAEEETAVSEPVAVAVAEILPVAPEVTAEEVLPLAIEPAAPVGTEAVAEVPEVAVEEVPPLATESAAVSVAEALPVAPDVIAEEVPSAAVEPVAPAVAEAVAVAPDVIAEEVPSVAVEPVAPAVAEAGTAAAELSAEEVSPVVTEPAAPSVAEVAALAPEEVSATAAPPIEEAVTVTPEVPAGVAPVVVTEPALELAKPEEAPAEVAEPAVAPIAEAVAPRKKRGKRAVLRETVLEAVAGVAAGPLSDIERYQLLLEQKPKDDELRLALARAYRDEAQMKLAIEQYGMLVRAKHKLLPEVIADVEGVVASRPDNLDAHQLLADLYSKNGELQKALERYHWVLERLREGAGN